MSFHSYPNCSHRYHTHGNQFPGSSNQQVVEDYNLASTTSALTPIEDVGPNLLPLAVPSDALGENLNAAYTPVATGVSIYPSQSFVYSQHLQRLPDITSGPGEWTPTTPTYSHQSYASTPVDNDRLLSHWSNPFKESQKLPQAAQVVVGPASDESRACGATLGQAALNNASNNLKSVIII
ncbi:hypothetical protein PQX77_012792 [Marasmius sp. AFHP31]|nr:hypothetical protein PQX77_012792 [Marasmius sp. AFHP31]